MAWQAIDPEFSEPPSEARKAQFEALIQASASRFPGTDLESMRNVVALVIAAAVGLGVGGPALFELLGMDDEAQAGFPDWLAGWVDQSLGED